MTIKLPNPLDFDDADEAAIKNASKKDRTQESQMKVRTVLAALVTSIALVSQVYAAEPSKILTPEEVQALDPHLTRKEAETYSCMSKASEEYKRTGVLPPCFPGRIEAAEVAEAAKAAKEAREAREAREAISGITEPKYPRSYAAWQRMAACVGDNYFHCDFTTQQCLRGNAQGSGLFVGEVLAADRTTVVAHVMRMQNYWLNFDTGEITPPGVRLDAFRVREDDQPMVGPPPSNCLPQRR